MSVRPVVQVIQTRATASVSQPRSVVVKVPGPQGPTGAQGPQGVKGDTGDSALTFAVGTVTTGAAGSAASVTDVGSDGDVILDFSIPEGNPGDPGISIDEGSGAADGDVLLYDANADVWYPNSPINLGRIVAVKFDNGTGGSLTANANVTYATISHSVSGENNLVYLLGLVPRASISSASGGVFSYVNAKIDDLTSTLETSEVAYRDANGTFYTRGAGVVNAMVSPGLGPNTYYLNVYFDAEFGGTATTSGSPSLLLVEVAV